LAPGSMHCILNYDFMFTRSLRDIPFIQWLETLVLGESAPETVACEGEECFMDPVCEACLESGGPGCNFCRGWPERHRREE
ncbi:MAG: hypothetical protein VYD19_06795, partial [Myxococcota bacterium]|nr:hypothetical protein [Myxococcota bacterium]